MLVKSATYKIQNRAITISIRPILFVATVIFLIYSMGSISQGTVPTQGRRGHYYEYETVKGFFMQSEDDTDDTKFDFREHNFGLIDRNYDTDATSKEEKIWKRFEKYVRDVAGKSEPGVHYKILFLGRHGQGWHNVAESKYGTEAWDCYWSMLDGAEGMIWADAHLTSTGQQQARDVHALWKAQIPQGIPLPETYYVSPLTRTIQTADLSFQGLDLPHDRAYKPFIKELIREALGVHTCDKRSTGSEIASAFPHLTFEPGFLDLDLLWEADYREPRSARKHRLSLALDDIFAQDSNIFLSVTSHSGAIGSILEAIGHRKFALETGGVIPVFVRAEKVHGQRETPPKEPSEGPPACEEPPNSVLS